MQFSTKKIISISCLLLTLVISLILSNYIVNDISSPSIIEGLSPNVSSSISVLSPNVSSSISGLSPNVSSSSSVNEGFQCNSLILPSRYSTTDVFDNIFSMYNSKL